MEDSKYFDYPKTGESWDVTVIGSGPSALTAAIYTTRGAASTILFAGDTWGGQLMLTTDVDNFPGFPDGIMGPDLMERMKKQVERFHAKLVFKKATEVKNDNDVFKIKSGEKTYTSKSVIIATGAETVWLGTPGEEKLRGRGVSSCAPCDAPFFKGKKVFVVGGGDAAMEEAVVLSKYASSVTMIHRRDAFRASAAMQKKVFDNKNISVIWDTEVSEMLGEEKLTSVSLKTKNGKFLESQKPSEFSEFNGKETKQEGEYTFWEVPTDGLFVAIGHKPSTSIFKDLIELDEKGYIKKQDKNGFKMATSTKGVFVAGDVHDIHYKQAITAAAFGCMAGMEALKYLDKQPPAY